MNKGITFLAVSLLLLVLGPSASGADGNKGCAKAWESVIPGLKVTLSNLEVHSDAYMAVQEYLDKVLSESASLCLANAQLGDPISQFYLGRQLLNSDKDSEALYWLVLAAKAGIVGASVKLSHFFLEGDDGGSVEYLYWRYVVALQTNVPVSDEEGKSFQERYGNDLLEAFKRRARVFVNGEE